MPNESLSHERLSHELLPSGSILKQALQTGPVDSGTAVLDGVSITVLDRGVILFEPANGDPLSQPLKSLLLSSGVHGNETAPIELVDALVNDLVSGRQSIAIRLLVILGNPDAMIQQSRFVEENLNRIFNGIHEQRSSLEADRAAVIEAHVERFFDGASAEGDGDRVHYDLHTAIRASAHERFAILPFGVDLPGAQMEFLAASEIQAVLLSNAPAGTFSYYSSYRFGAESFTVELGKVRPFGENDPSRLAAIDHQLRRLLAGQSVESDAASFADEETQPGDVPIYSVIHEVMRRCDDGFELHIEDDVANFTELPVGHVLTTCSNRRIGGLDRRVGNAQRVDGPERRVESERRSESGQQIEAASGGSGSFRDFVVSEPGSAIVFPIRGVPIGQRVALIVKRQADSTRDPSSTNDLIP